MGFFGALFFAVSAIARKKTASLLKLWKGSFLVIELHGFSHPVISPLEVVQFSVLFLSPDYS